MRQAITIIDVRTPAEFQNGRLEGSINIPLHEIPSRLQEIKSLSGSLILCCASGSRSGQATHYLRNNGIECENGGSWYRIANEVG